MVDALVYDLPGQAADAHWNEEAKALISGLILHIICAEPLHTRSLAKVRDYLTGSPQEFQSLLDAMQQSPGAGGLIRRAANVADIDTASWVSKSIGATTMSYQTTGASTSRGPLQPFSTRSSSTTDHVSRRDLMTPDEVMRLDASLEILLRQGDAAVIAAKVRYYADVEFRGW